MTYFDRTQRVVLTAGWIFDGMRDAPLRDHALVIEGTSIAGLVTKATAPSDVETRDLGSVTLMPGLVDCHVHLPFDASRDPGIALSKLPIAAVALQAFQHAQVALASGITSVRDVSCPYGVSIALRDAIERGDVAGPRVLAVGRAICITGGHGSRFGIEADGRTEIRKAVRSQLKAGADWIKLMGTGGVYSPPGSKETPESVQLLPDELEEAAAVTHGLNRRVACHAEGAEGIRVALEAGIDTIEHGNWLDASLGELMVANGAALVPTVSAFQSCAFTPELPDAIRRPAAVLVEAHKHCLRTAHELDVRVAVGTDSGTAMYMPWEDHYLAAEVADLVSIGGFPVARALKAATSAAAAVLGCDDLTGSLVSGKRADVIALAGNAFDDIEALRRPVLVMKEGAVFVDRSSAARTAGSSGQYAP